MTRITATTLHELTESALEICTAPNWPAPDDPQTREWLVYLAGDEDNESCWVLMPDYATDDEDAELVPLDPALTATLIAQHLRGWLLARGWQVRAECGPQSIRWRLADVLAISEGGGDRLHENEGYPQGEDELSILCESVMVVARNFRAAREHYTFGQD